MSGKARSVSRTNARQLYPYGIHQSTVSS